MQKILPLMCNHGHHGLKSSSKEIMGINIKPYVIKVLEEVIRENLCNLV